MTPESMAPVARSVLAIVYSNETSFSCSIASWAASMIATSFTVEIPWSWSMTWRMAALLSTRASSLVKSIRACFGFGSFSSDLRSIKSVRPIISSILVNPISARYSRTSCARKVKKLIRYSLRPWKRLRNSSFCVATPTGQVFWWHLRIITHPSTIRAEVAKPYSSAPINAIMIMSRPVFNWPSACRTTCPRRPFRTKVCCVSLSPSSGEMPA